MTAWLVLICLGVLTLLDFLLLIIGQFGHDFNNGGPNPPGLQYEWLIVVLKIGALIVSRRSGLPLLLVGVIDFVYGVAFFEMHVRHISFASALSEDWLATSFLLFSVVYAIVSERRRFQQSNTNR
jgi:hypothetical protein